MTFSRHAIHAIAGIATVLLVTGLVVVGMHVAVGHFQPSYLLTATYPEVGQGLDTFSEVRIRGLRVGTVERVELDEQGTAVVTMKIDDGVQVPLSARAVIEPLSVFGPKFIDVVPGELEATGPYLEAGDRFVDTAAPTELGVMLARVAELLEAIEPGEVGAIVETLADGFVGTGEQWGRILDASDDVLDIFERNADGIRDLLTDTAHLATVLADHSDEFFDLAVAVTEFLPELTTREDDWLALLRATSRGSVQLAELLTEHRDALAATLRGLSRTAAVLGPRAGELPVFLEGLITFFSDLADVARVPEPDGTRSAAVQGVTPADPCLLLSGLPCPEGGLFPSPTTGGS